MSNFRFFQMKRADEAEWVRTNPILQPGEPGFSRDTNTMKVGDGIRRWTELEPIAGATSWITATMTSGSLTPLNITIE